MKQEEAIVKLYDFWKECIKNPQYCNNKTINDYYSEKDIKLIFLSSAILGIVTYDKKLDLTFGRMIFDTIVQIKNRTTFEYIKNEENYKNYILSCNFIEDWLDWGTSIRGAWFNYTANITPDECLSNIEYDGDTLQLTEEFMQWFVEWFNKDEI